MIITALLAAVATAAAPYFVPFLIACGVGLVTTIGTAIGGYYLGKAQKTRESAELASLRQELSVREKKVRQSANTLAQTTANDVDILLKQSKEQHARIDTNINKLDESLTQINHVSKNLDQTTTALDKATDEAQLQVKTTSVELETVKLDMTTNNKNFKSSQTSIQEKVKTLNDALTQLNLTQQGFEKATQNGTDKVIELTNQLTEVQILLKQTQSNDALKDAEIEALYAEITRLTNLIQNLESTLKRLALDYKKSSQVRKEQQDEINILYTDNKQLNQAIVLLSHALENQSEVLQTQLPSNPTRSPRLFNA